MGMLDKKNKKEKDMAVGRLPPAGRGPSQAFGLAWASYFILLSNQLSATSAAVSVNAGGRRVGSRWRQPAAGRSLADGLLMVGTRYRL